MYQYYQYQPLTAEVCLPDGQVPGEGPIATSSTTAWTTQSTTPTTIYTVRIKTMIQCQNYIFYSQFQNRPSFDLRLSKTAKTRLTKRERSLTGGKSDIKDNFTNIT